MMTMTITMMMTMTTTMTMMMMMMMVMMPDNNHLTTIGNQMEMAAGKFGSLGDWLRFFFGFIKTFSI